MANSNVFKTTDIIVTTSSLNNTINQSNVTNNQLTNNLNEMLLNNKKSFEQWSKEKKLDKLSSYSACQVNF
jgi:hypothetical protein